ncbi:MAG TPA: MFS transporter [Gammaproteobacteria bacterium]
MTAPSARPRPASVLSVLFAGVLMAALDIAVVGPALPALQDGFGIGDRALSWVFSIYILFNVAGAPLIAKWSDRYGRRPLFVASVGLFAAGSALVAAAPTFDVLLVGRAVQAFGAGGVFPVASAVVAETFPMERRGRALGLIGAVFGLAFLLGPLLGGLILPLGWRWLFLINLPIAAAVIVAAVRLLPVRPAHRAGRFDAGGALLLCVVLLGAAWGVNRLDAGRLPAALLAPDVWPGLLAAGIAAILLVLVERRASDPILPPALWRSVPLRAVGGIAVAAGLVEAGMVFLPELAVGAFDVEPASASLMMLPLVLTLIAGAPAAGYLLDRIGPRTVIQAGLVLTGAGLATFHVQPLGIGTFYTAGALVGLGLAALLGAPLRYVVLRESGESRRGAGQGLLTLFLSAGQLVGSAAIGAVAGSTAHASAGYASALLSLAGACVVVLPLTFLIEPRANGAELPARDEAHPGS